MRKVSNKICKENQNTYLTCMFSSSFPKNRTVFETMWKNMVEPERPQMAIQYGACALHAVQGYSK